MKNLSIEEYLEVPELKYNRITATGNEFWVTDAGVIDDVLDDDDGVFLITLKEKPGEVTINFQYKDILRGIFYTQDENGQPMSPQAAELTDQGPQGILGLRAAKLLWIPMVGVRFTVAGRFRERIPPKWIAQRHIWLVILPKILWRQELLTRAGAVGVCDRSCRACERGG